MSILTDPLKFRHRTIQERTVIVCPIDFNRSDENSLISRGNLLGQTLNNWSKLRFPIPHLVEEMWNNKLVDLFSVWFCFGKNKLEPIIIIIIIKKSNKIKQLDKSVFVNDFQILSKTQMKLWNLNQISKIKLQSCFKFTKQPKEEGV